MTPVRYHEPRGPSTFVATASALLVASALAHPARGGNDGSQVGLDDLAARIGAENVPTGAGVIAGQVEFPEGSSYGPDEMHPEFAGKIFFTQSGPAGASSHATTVGRDFYGLTDSIAPGIGTIHLYEALGFVLGDYLRTNAPGSRPALPPAGLRLVNSSWIAGFDDTAIDDAALRRADFAAVRDGILFVNGVNNAAQSSHFPLMAYMFNGIAVGRMDGAHASGDTPASHDGPGRMKPEIVAPGGATSWAAPVVAAAAALMLEATAANPLPTEVLKAALLAGAEHRDGWSNDAVQSGAARGIAVRPLDPVFGADLVDVDETHRIVTAEPTAGEAQPPDACTAGPAGWSLASVPAYGSVFYRFDVAAHADELSIVAAWHRSAAPPFASWDMADVDIELWRVDGAGVLHPLAGDEGLDVFAAGNVVSASPVDNVEHLYIVDLVPGSYVLELRRVDALDAFGTWNVGVAWRRPATDASGPDVNGDGHVDVDDLLEVILAWGPCAGCPADVDGDGVVGVDDLIAVLLAWT